MPQWEYQVIHLNFQGGASPAAPMGPEQVQNPAATAGSSPAKSPQVFSKEYLAKEFPGFYTQNSGGQQHPALQLQTFLNGFDQQSWSLIGVFPLGPLFDDELSPPPGRRSARGHRHSNCHSNSNSSSSRPRPHFSFPGSEPTADLEILLQRIERREQRFDTPPAQA